TYTRQADTNLLLAETDALGRRMEYTYDTLGNKTSVEKLDARSSRSVTVFLHEAFGQTRFTQGTPAEIRLPRQNVESHALVLGRQDTEQIGPERFDVDEIVDGILGQELLDALALSQAA